MAKATWVSNWSLESWWMALVLLLLNVIEWNYCYWMELLLLSGIIVIEWDYCY